MTKQDADVLFNEYAAGAREIPPDALAWYVNREGAKTPIYVDSVVTLKDGSQYGLFSFERYPALDAEGAQTGYSERIYFRMPVSGADADEARLALAHGTQVYAHIRKGLRVVLAGIDRLEQRLRNAPHTAGISSLPPPF